MIYAAPEFLIAQSSVLVTSKKNRPNRSAHSKGATRSAGENPLSSQNNDRYMI